MKKQKDTTNQDTTQEPTPAQLAGDVRSPKTPTIKTRRDMFGRTTLADILGLASANKPNKKSRHRERSTDNSWRKKTRRYKINDMRGGKR